MRLIPAYLPGLALCALIAVISWQLSALLKARHLILEPLVLAILIGFAVAAALGKRPALKPGVSFAARTVLELAIVLLGFRLSFAKLAALGGPALLGVVLFVPLIVLAAVPLGRLFRLPPKLAVLIGVGSGICGSSAIAAVAPVIGADEEDAALAVGGLSVLGAAAVLLYAAIAHRLPLSETQYGVWAGLSMQAVPNALAAAFARGDVAGEAGTIVKMARVALLAPIALGLALWFSPGRAALRGGSQPSAGTESGATKKRRVAVPLYVILFVLAGVVNSLGLLPETVTTACASASAILMVVAMAALGLGIDFASLRSKAGPAFAMSLLLFVLVSVSAYLWCAGLVS